MSWNEEKTFSKDEIINLFSKVSITSRREDGRIKDRNFRSDLIDALIDAGKGKMYELEAFIFNLLEDPDVDIRGEAISTLGYPTRLQSTAFRDKALEIWMNLKEDTENRRRALSAWHTYYFQSKNSLILKILYHALTHSYPVDLRVESAEGILETCGIYLTAADSIPFSRIADTKSHMVVNEKLDWQQIHHFMRQYAPDVSLIDFEKLPKDNEKNAF